MNRKTQSEQAQEEPLPAQEQAGASRAIKSAYPFYGMQRTIGNQAVQQLLGHDQRRSAASPTQGSQSNAEFFNVTKTANAASEVPIRRACACHSSGSSGGKCATCAKEDELRRSSKADGNKAEGAPEVVHQVLRSTGQPLDEGTRSFMAARFGRDFHDVRISTGGQAAHAADAIQAKAFTWGNRVVFGRDEYNPHSSSGLHLLAHELAHTAQQSGAKSLQTNLKIGSVNDPQEREADRAADAVVRGQSVSTTTSSGKAVMRQADEAAASQTIADESRESHRGELADAIEEIRRKREEGFRKLSDEYRKKLLKGAGIQGQTIASPDDALAILKSLNVDLSVLDDRVKQIRASMGKKLEGTTTAESVSKESTDAIAALSPKGQETFRKGLEAVRKEPFYGDFLSTGQVEIIPDESACVRYGGYTQYGQEQETIPGSRTAKRRHYIVHVCKKKIESGNASDVEAIVAHELSHSVEKEFAGEEVATLVSKPVLKDLAAQLAKLPKYAGMEKVLLQFLFEHIGGYSEAEIFVALQQVPHDPTLLKDDRLLAMLICDLRRIDASGFPKEVRDMLVRELRLRTEFFYDERIRQESDKGAQRLAKLKMYALNRLDLALEYRKLEQISVDTPFEIKCGQ